MRSLILLCVLAAVVIAQTPALTVKVASVREHPVAMLGGPMAPLEWTWVVISGGAPETAAYRVTCEKKDGTRFTTVWAQMGSGWGTNGILMVPRADVAAVSVEELKPTPPLRVAVE